MRFMLLERVKWVNVTNNKLVKENETGTSEWLEIKPISGSWNHMALDQFTLCTWVLHTFYGASFRFAQDQIRSKYTLLKVLFKFIVNRI